MKIVAKTSKFKELLCVLFGHLWDEYGSKTCGPHKITYDESNTCSRCGLEYHTQRFCDDCYSEFQDKFMGDRAKAQQA